MRKVASKLRSSPTVFSSCNRLRGFAYSGHHAYDADGCVSFSPVPFLRVQGGYRYLDLKVDDDEIVAELKLKGPYAGLQLSF